MTDSSSFTSLLALVDSHLSNCSIREEESNGQTPFPMPFALPSLGGNEQNGTFSDTRLPSLGQRLPLPKFSASVNPINNILSEQLSNMFKAKEIKKKQEEEKLRLADENRKTKLEEDNFLIDLMPAIRKPSDTIPKAVKKEQLSKSKFRNCLQYNQSNIYNHINHNDMTSNPVLLQCKSDMSYILHHKTKMNKCSSFGKVLTARIRPVAAPYMKMKVDESGVVRFHFDTKSPDDLIKEKLRRPTCSSAKQIDLVAEFLALHGDE